MTLHAAFCSVLSTIVIDYESDDPDTHHCMKHAEKLAGQFRKQEDMVWTIYKDSKSASFVNGLKYGSSGEVVLRQF